MEDLTHKCDNLSLSAWEGKKVVLTKAKRVSDYVLVAKFFTRRAVNMEAVGRTFRPLWHTKESFHITNVGNNILLFTFDLETDGERVLMGEPWSYDKHLVVLQRTDGSMPINEIGFRQCKFWIQIHDIPFNYMTPKTALEIGKSIGHVSIPQDSTEMKGGTFLRVRVTVDISRPLCKGRKVAFDDKMEG